jgi:hypothetical protein
MNAMPHPIGRIFVTWRSALDAVVFRIVVATDQRQCLAVRYARWTVSRRLCQVLHKRIRLRGEIILIGHCGALP